MFKRLSLLTALALASCNPASQSASGDVGWEQHGGTAAELRFADLDQIHAGNVGELKLAWYVDLDTNRGQEATPLVVDGVLYTTTAWSKAIAVNAATGEQLWSYDPEVPGKTGANACCDVVNRGPAFADGKLFISTLDGRLIALDARTGKPVWSTMTVDPARPYTITGAPRVAKGKVFIGNGGGEYGVRGYVSAYDAATGKLAWRFYTVPGKPGIKDGAASDEPLERLARPTWFGDKYHEYGGGGTVWDSIVYDEELDQLYIGVGNGSPWNRQIRSEDKGDNLFLSSIVALDPSTGAYRWHYQQVPGETWDFTATQQMTLATLPIDGADRQVILHAPKNGFFYVIDRTSGKLLSAEKFVPANWASHIDMATGRPVETPGARFTDEPFLATSGASGAHNWQPMAFSPKTGLMYIPAQQVPFLYVADTKFRYTPGRWNLGVDMMSTPLPDTPEAIAAMDKALEGRLIAWDPVRQREAWRVPHASTWNGGVLATAGGLVFQGLTDGTFNAYDASNGNRLWSFDAQNSILAGAISYRVGGKQYVAVMVGNGGGLPLALPAFGGPKPLANGRILAFALEGTARLPARSTSVAELSPPQETWPAAVVATGQAKYAENCASCHGMGTLSAGVVPDLRRSGALGNTGAWRAIVIDGVLEDRGMVSFADHLSPADAEAIRGYVAGEARKAARRTASRAN